MVNLRLNGRYAVAMPGPETFARVVKELRCDVLAARDRDPAAREAGRVEILATWPGIHALLAYRVAHALQQSGVRVLPRLLSMFTRAFTGIEIHPSAQIGRGLFIDHGAGVVIGVCDTGLLASTASASWLGGITGEVDSLGPLLANGLYDIPRYCGHGTFIAGVARCEAPESTIYVANDYINGALQEWKVVQQLQALIANQAPQVVNLSAGSYTRNDWMPLSFSVFDHGGVTLVCAAGNDAIHRRFWPAAFDWAVAVGGEAAMWQGIGEDVTSGRF